MTPGPDSSSTQSDLALISNAIVRVMLDATGRGPTKVRTTITDDSVLVMIRDGLTKAERTLVDAGYDDAVLETRRTFQRTMRNDMVNSVESILDREVIAFMSANHLAPDLAAEIFVLKPLD
jgi:uncharacterized protein YbcI